MHDVQQIFKITGKHNHFKYKDDIKVFAKNEKEQETLI